MIYHFLSQFSKKSRSKQVFGKSFCQNPIFPILLYRKLNFLIFVSAEAKHWVCWYLLVSMFRLDSKLTIDTKINIQWYILTTLPLHQLCYKNWLLYTKVKSYTVIHILLFIMAVKILTFTSIEKYGLEKSAFKVWCLSLDQLPVGPEIIQSKPFRFRLQILI